MVNHNPTHSGITECFSLVARYYRVQEIDEHCEQARDHLSGGIGHVLQRQTRPTHTNKLPLALIQLTVLLLRLSYGLIVMGVLVCLAIRH